MIATTGGTAVASVTTIVTRLLFNPSPKEFVLKAKGGAWRLPLSLFYCVVSEARWKHACFASDAHRKSGVISCSAALSPVES
jgi:hypothetical protein